MTDISSWFECPKCGEDENVKVKQVLGLGNFSVNFECSCGYRFVERDANSKNWSKSVRFKQHLTGQRLKAPKASRKGHKLVRCPICNVKDVEFWIYSDNSGLGDETTGRTRLNCKHCDTVEHTKVSRD